MQQSLNLNPISYEATRMPSSLDEILSIYKYPFFSDNEHYKFVKENMESCKDTANLVALKGQDPGNDERYNGAIQSHFSSRVPVYFGRIIKSYFDDEKLTRVLGYSSKEAETMWERELKENSLEPQYAIVGPVHMMNGRKNVAIVHTWGVNLESENTNAYNYYVKSGWKQDDFKQYYINMFQLICKAAQHVSSSSSSSKFDSTSSSSTKKARVRCPLIGMGQFLSALPHNEKHKAYQAVADATREVFSSKSWQNVELTFCIYSNTEPLIALLQDIPNITLGIGRSEGNLMNLPAYHEDKMDIIVNAWDNRSFIGNGGSKDGTIDGFVVANANRWNDAFRNTSYLHNVFFNPSIRDPSNWIFTSSSNNIE